MSEINDALKRARQAPADKSNEPRAIYLPPRPVEKTPTVLGWLIPAFIVVLVVAAVFFIGWAATHRHAQKVIAVPNRAAPVPPVADIAPTVSPSATLTTAPTPLPAQIVAPATPPLPKLQGIFYSPNAPTAILGGKTIGLGDKFGDYRVQHISPTAVTLVDASGREIKIEINH